MAKAGRKPDLIPTVRWDLYIASDLAATVELLLTDPARQRVKYGARSELIESLLRKWRDDRVANLTARVAMTHDQLAFLISESVEFHSFGDGTYEIPRKYAVALKLVDEPQKST